MAMNGSDAFNDIVSSPCELGIGESSHGNDNNGAKCDASEQLVRNKSNNSVSSDFESVGIGKNSHVEDMSENGNCKDLSKDQCESNDAKYLCKDFFRVDSNPCNPTLSFFQNIWQKQPAIFRCNQTKTDEYEGNSTPSILHKTLNMSWDDIANLLYYCRELSEHSSSISSNGESDSKVNSETPNKSPPQVSPPLFFQNGTPITDPHTMYGCNPHAAYLDGCSVIVNHADLLPCCTPSSSHRKELNENTFNVLSTKSPIANLCTSLQNTFPHVYANAYLTPPNGYAVKAHADDRDVMVVQVKGRKRWKIYKNVPLEFPFANEQFGKSGFYKNASVLKNGLCFNDKEIVLNEGDVLYMPRGFVHEATTQDANQSSPDNLLNDDHFSPSFHITLALATHDWCMSVAMSEAIRRTLDNVTSFRKALPIGPCTEYEQSGDGQAGDSLSCASFLQKQINEAMESIQKNITVSSLEKDLRNKYELHNSHANEIREQLAKIATVAGDSRKRKRTDGDNDDGRHSEYVELVGYRAASKVTLASTVRVSTPEERSSVVLEEGRLRGLTVREETFSVLMEMLGVIKSDAALRVKVCDMRNLLIAEKGSELENDRKVRAKDLELICDFSLLSFVRCCVELGALSVTPEKHEASK